MRNLTRLSSALAGLIIAFACSCICGQDTFWLHEATVQRINTAFNAGVLTSERLVQMYLNRIQAYDEQGPAINSIITLNSRALETARALDIERQATGPRSVLHGIPILIKDQLDTFDMPTTHGSLAFKNGIAAKSRWEWRKSANTC